MAHTNNTKFPPSPIDRTSSSSHSHTERLNVLSTDVTLRNNLADTDPATQFRAACKFSNQAHAVMPKKQRLVEAGVVPILVKYLTDSNPAKQQEAISSITKIAAVSSEYAVVVVKEDTVPVLAALLENPNQDISEMAVHALGTIASGNPVARNLTLDQMALPPLLTLIARTVQHTSMLRTAAWALSNLCGGTPPPPFSQVSESLPTLVRLVNSVDEEVIACACWAFASITRYDDEKMTSPSLVHTSSPPSADRVNRIHTCMVDTQIVKRVVDFLVHRSMAVQLPAVKTVANMAAGDAEQIQLLLDNRVISHLEPLLQSPRVQVRSEACRAIGNIATGEIDQIQAVIDSHIIPKLILLAAQDSVQVVREVILAFSNILKGSNEQVTYLVEQGCIQPLCDHVLASNSDFEQVSKALEALEKILIVGEGKDADENPYAVLFQQAGGLERFDLLQFHNNTHIYDKSNEILWKYFKVSHLRMATGTQRSNAGRNTRWNMRTILQHANSPTPSILSLTCNASSHSKPTTTQHQQKILLHFDSCLDLYSTVSLSLLELLHNCTYDPLVCSICSEKFNRGSKQALLLQCFHTFCNECLQHLANPPPSPSPSPLDTSLIELSSITCPLCTKVTLRSASSPLPINQILQDIVETAAATSGDKLCDFHNEDHLATYWCFECKQGMCDEGHIMHSRARGTMHHQTSKMGTQQQVVRKQVLCAVHGKELDLVCTHDSHPPQMVCISCVVTTHQSHPCVTTADYFNGKQADLRALLERAKASEDRLAQGVEVVGKEQLSIVENRESVRSSLNSLFTKIRCELDAQQNEVLAQLDSTTNRKGVVLRRQSEGLVASLEGLRLARHQLETVLGTNSEATALALMEQLHKNLDAVDQSRLAPLELPEALYPFQVRLIDVPVAERTYARYQLELSTPLPLSLLQITCTSSTGMEISLQITSLGSGKYRIKDETRRAHTIIVKLFGHHVQGSPITIPHQARMTLKHRKAATRMMNMHGDTL